MVSQKDIDRFWLKVAIGEPDQCWEWQAAKKQGGYGKLTFQKKSWLAHRFAYFLENGKIDPSLQIAHLCHNPACCNPRHLRQMTEKEHKRMDWDAGRYNTLEFMAAREKARLKTKGRSKPSSVGEKNPKAKLNESQALEIYHSCETNSALAKRFAVSRNTIWRIKTGKQWAHITQAPKYQHQLFQSHLLSN